MYCDTLRISAKEALELADSGCMLSDIRTGREIYAAFISRILGDAPDRAAWNWDCLFGAIFFAGRVQGVREERARRRAKAARSEDN